MRSFYRFKRLALVGDSWGIPMLAEHVPREFIKCIIAASIRPTHFNKLKKAASDLKVPLLIQPKFGSSAYLRFSEEFKDLEIDMILCNSYSMKIRENIRKDVHFNCINIHSAFLPANRGPNPIQYAIIKGMETTGVTMHYMDDQFDRGDIIARCKVPINFTDNWLTLRERIAVATKEILREQADLILRGENERFKQDEGTAWSHCRLTPEFPRIDFKQMTDNEIYNLIRAQVAPLKGAFLETEGKRIYFKEMLSLEQVTDLRNRYGTAATR